MSTHGCAFPGYLQEADWSLMCQPQLGKYIKIITYMHIYIYIYIYIYREREREREREGEREREREREREMDVDAYRSMANLVYI